MKRTCPALLWPPACRWAPRLSTARPSHGLQHSVRTPHAAAPSQMHGTPVLAQQLACST
jgi:hypothetical protein